MRDQAHVPAGSPTAWRRHLQSPRITDAQSHTGRRPLTLPAGFQTPPSSPLHLPPHPPTFSAISELPDCAEARDPARLLMHI